LAGLLLLMALLAGCDDARAPTPTAIPPTPAPPTAIPFTVPPTVPPRPTAAPPLLTVAVEPTLPPAEDSPTPEPPTASPEPIIEALTDATVTPPGPPNPPAVAALLEDTYANMAALPGYYFTATIAVSDFGRPVNTTLDGAYARPDRLQWTTRIDEAATQGIIVGPDYYVSQDGDSWLQVPGARAALDQYRLWATLHDAVGADLSPHDDPESPLTRLFYALDAAHLPLPPVSEPWRLIEVGVWIGREDHLLHRLDLAAQTANYLLEEHMYFSGFGAVLDIQPPADESGLPPAEPTPDYLTPIPERTPYGGRTFNPFTAPGRGMQPLNE
jgi:hypothetical protein